MKTLRDRLEYRPQRVTEAVARVLQLHPDPGSARIDIGILGTQAVRDQLREAAATGQHESLAILARSLKRGELRVVARGLVEWPELADAAERVILLRDSPEVNPILWNNLVAAPEHAPSARVLSKLAEHPRALWPMGDTREFLRQWLKSPDLPSGVRTWLRGKGRSLDEERDREGSLLGRDSRLTGRIAGRILQHGDRDEIGREPHGLLIWGWEGLPPESRVNAGRNYLETVLPDDWADVICGEIRDSYGLPRAPAARRSFWDAVSEESKKAFQRKFILQALEGAFLDHDRQRYWSLRWADYMTDVFRGSAGGTRYSIMLFPGFGVVEFFETGNAAYFYDLETARGLTNTRPWSPSDLKTRYRYPVDRRAGLADNRLIHSSDWYRTADRRMARWLGSPS